MTHYLEPPTTLMTTGTSPVAYLLVGLQLKALVWVGQVLHEGLA